MNNKIKNKFIITTVATHDDGMYQKLINNRFNSVKILGFGMKWTGFKMKYELVYDYIKDLDDDIIIIFLDGFDSLILRDPKIAIKEFIGKKYKILFSKEVDTKFKNIVFPNCRNNFMINSGLYMGYVKYLKIILKDMLNEVCNDDQVIINRKCKNYDFISIDKDSTIFKNIGKFENLKPGNAIFVQYPAQTNHIRLLRGVKEYSQFVLFPLFFINILLGYYLLKNNKINYIYIQMILSLIFYNYIDKTCI